MFYFDCLFNKLSVANVVQSQLGGRIVNDDSEGIWKERVMAKFEALTHHFLTELGKNTQGSSSVS
jgi:hypothetical protein